MPGNGAVAFLPSDISNLALWLDASDAATITESGGAVSAWADKSGNGNDATQGSAPNQPTYQATGLNGKPTLHFAADHLNVADDISLDHTGLTVFVVTAATVDNAGSHYILWKWLDTTNREFILRHDFNNNDTRFFSSSNGSAVDGSITGGALNLGTAQILEVINDNGAATGSQLLIDGASVGTDSTPGTIFNGSDSLKVGHSSGGGEKVISEVLLYTQPLNTDQRDQIRTYLTEKWGIA